MEYQAVDKLCCPYCDSEDVSDTKLGTGIVKFNPNLLSDSFITKTMECNKCEQIFVARFHFSVTKIATNIKP